MPFRPLLLALLSVSLVGPALANDRRYNVEIVILENTDTGAGGIERWRPVVVEPEIEGAAALAGPVELAPMVRADELTELPNGFESLPSDQRKLGGAIEKLRESGGYRVLRHLAWQQPALGEEEAPKIRVHNGEAMTVRVPIRDFEELHALEEDSARTTDSASTDTTNGNGADTGGSQTRTFGADRTLGTRMQPLLRPTRVHPLDGTIRLVVSRYLHIYTDLYLTAPVEWTALPGATAEPDEEQEESGETGEPDRDETRPLSIDTTQIARGPEGRAMLSYPFVQHRRMRSGELHYLDHPVLGLLIRVDRAGESETDSDSDG